MKWLITLLRRILGIRRRPTSAEIFSAQMDAKESEEMVQAERLRARGYLVCEVCGTTNKSPIRKLHDGGQVCERCLKLYLVAFAARSKNNAHLYQQN
jgi:hypothetical protein